MLTEHSSVYAITKDLCMKNHEFPLSEQPPRPNTIPLSGDNIIQSGEGLVAYDTQIPIAGNVDEVWNLVSRWGLPQDGAAGLYLAPSTERLLPRKYRSLPTLGEILETEQLFPGDSVTDGPKGHKARVLEHTDEGLGVPKTLLLESDQWPNGWHYTYQFYAAPGETPDTTILLARTRWEGAKNPERTTKYAPVADAWFMRQMKRGIEERLAPERIEARGSRKSTAIATMAGVAIGAAIGFYAARRRDAHN
jgi:hypothetical protein